MGLLGDIFSFGNTVKRNVKGLLADPSGTLEQWGDQAKNYRNNVVPTISGGLLDNRKMTEAEQMQKTMELASSFAPIGMTVWHGSPHKFSKFDMSKIGTGEGAQAYGHGLYVAESQNVAKEYAGANAGRAAASEGTIDALPKPVQMEVFKAMQMKDGPFKKAAIDDILQRYPEAEGVVKSKNPTLYKVDIPDEAVARFLDWDKPLSEEVRQPLSKALMDKFGSGVSMGSGEQAYKQVLDEFKFAGHQDPKNAAIQWMNENGIPGIRYLDGGSRSAGQGSSNFVLFSDQLPRILEINGQATGLQPWAKGEWRGLLD